jgi:hypothetical protein
VSEVWVAAAVRGYLAGRFGSGPMYAEPGYREIPYFTISKTVYRRWYQRGREIQQDRIQEGKEQAPGSVYDPRLDDKRGAFTDRDYKAYFREGRDNE